MAQSQVATPAKIKKKPKPPKNYNTALASEHAKPDPTWVVELAVGTQVWVLPGAFFNDDKGSLWMRGRSSRASTSGPDVPLGAAYTLIERVEEGVRVLSWPAGIDLYYDVAEPNENGPFDLWVMEFPT